MNQMSYLIKIFLLLSLLFFISFGCKSPQSGAVAANCDHTGTLKDYTGLDGCKWMIETDAGKKLLPAKIDPAFKMKDNLKIRFSYKELDAMGSICMAEDMIVEITCIETLDTRP